MAFLEWRKFTFFDIHNNVDDGKIAKSLQDTNVRVSTSGNNHVVLCDVTGWAHLISRSWEINMFKAYEKTITLAQQLPHDPFLITIGDDTKSDEAGTNLLIKVWDWSRTDRHGSPVCVRASPAVPSHLRATPATALAVHENKNLLAVGFQDGSVTLYHGDITRQRSSKMKTLPDTGTSPITGLAFKGTDNLFIVSRSSVMVMSLRGDKCTSLDAMGAASGCSVLADNRHFTIATVDAIYCYSTEGRGACYALKGDKVRLNWFRSYLVITTNETSDKSQASTSSAPAAKSHHITIIDIQNKFIVFSKTFEEIDAVLTEWGSFYILTKKKEMIYLHEKDLQTKLNLLFKKNLYDVAIRIAGVHHYDAEGLTEIYKQYGDHLYNKGDFKGAIDQYVKTIGWLETSYVIRKYLESRQLEPLVQYLEELHKKGYATEDHTTLLLTCYVKIDQHDQQGKLKEFINSKDKAIDFDVDVAIKVVRQVSTDDALTLAANFKQHDWYLKLMLDDVKDYRKALDYIADLEFEDAEIYMKKYGHRLLQQEPEESTKFLTLLCTDYKPRSQPLVDEITLSGNLREPERALPDDYIHMFLSHSERLVHFLEKVTAVEPKCSKLVYNTLIEHYIHVWAASVGDEKQKYEDKVMKLLKDPETNYDKNQTLVICHMLGFKTGMLHLYEEKKLWRLQLLGLVRSGQWEGEGALGVCRRRGGAVPRLWLDALHAPPPPHALPELLNHIANKKLLSPILVIDCLTNASTSYTLGDVRKYLMNVLKSEHETFTREQELCEKYRAESTQLKEAAESLRRAPQVFQSSRCAACERPLELPTIHFLCQHSYHQYCFESFSERDECTKCAASRRPAPPPRSAESLHARLSQELDPYAVVSEYFSLGLFNKVTVVADTSVQEPLPVPASQPVPQSAPQPAPLPAPQTYGPGAEAKLRLQEGQSKQVYVPNAANQVAPKGTTVVPMPEGRMRILEQQNFSTTVQPKIHNKSSPYGSPKPTKSSSYALPMPKKKSSQNLSGSPKISAAISNGQNPFKEVYDDTKNPFAVEVAQEPTNPFSEEDDYDTNLNPFS